ncbi:MAG: HD domain-containing phosphohydrolase [Rubrivivax sp.]|nr:HD domain-containing phosphohydrolase [Rubrivivax sp.]
MPYAPTAGAAAPDPAHFAKAVTNMGDKRPVVAHSAIYNNQGLKIVDKGIAVDAKLYERLVQHTLKSPLDDSLESEPGVTARVLREQVEILLAREPFFARMLATPRTRDMLLDGLGGLPIPPPIGFQLTLLRETQPELWLHSLRSAVTAGWLASRIEGTRYDVAMLAAGGLLHDLGMLHLDPVLLQPEIELSGDQRRQLYTHPLLASMLLERHHKFPRELLRAILEHHETLDGSGYPRNVSAASLSPWGRVLSLTEVVTAMFSPDRQAPELRLSMVLRMNRHRYDETLVKEVMALLRPDADAQAITAAADPVSALREIDGLLQRWPEVAAAVSAEAGSAKVDLAPLQEQVGQIQRSLAGAGVSADQLDWLGETWREGTVAQELTLILHEVAWQLRSMTRQVRRRWRTAEGGLPAALGEWLASADALCAHELSRGADSVPP